MARIRTIKPEAFHSESLAEVSVHAERTFLGLLTQADDQGRFRDNAAIINGLLWPLRAEHTAVHAEDDLQQLADAGLICRYTGCDGRRYLHVVTWHEHQKIDKPSQSRLPACPAHHHATDRCGPCKGPCTVTPPQLREDSALPAGAHPEGAPTSARGFGEGSANPPRTLDRPAPAPVPPAPKQPERADGRIDGSAERSGGPGRAAAPSTPTDHESAGRSTSRETPGNLPRSLGEPSAPGSRILDPGSVNPSGREAPAPSPSARALIGEYAAACATRPPEKVLGHLGREVRNLLDEGIDPRHVRAGLERFRAKPMHPSVLASLVNEAMNAHGGRLVRPEIRPTVPGHTAWTNHADAAAYTEEL
ncbi:hypothetical protein RKE29_01215 [Streptomyces sp. B1866]|uniref:hypothetical protein n=1 Tax=Streptomyces sp. B1866 TaxID=3075431 RepID=UPI002890089D|nr:hypothetical protein [Streptomyces sp. B1866]MDT3395280.1 hypothetical protein [Streptomyces sp. B1866]